MSGALEQQPLPRPRLDYLGMRTISLYTRGGRGLGTIEHNALGVTCMDACHYV